MTPTLTAALARLVDHATAGEYIRHRQGLVQVMDRTGYWRPVESLLEHDPGRLRDAVEHVVEELGLTWTLGRMRTGTYSADVSTLEWWEAGHSREADTAGEALLLALDAWVGRDV